MRYAYLAVVLLTFGASGTNCAGCPPTPTPIPVTDSGVTNEDAPIPTPTGDASQTNCQLMCAKLDSFGCPEAKKHGLTKCSETCEQVISSGITNLNVNCILSDSTADKQAVQKCGIKCE